MQTEVRLGRLFGIPIGLHYSWLIIASLVVLSLAGFFQVSRPEWNPLAVWATAGFAAFLFFACLILHEMAHALVERARGLTVRSITLFALGGVARIGKDAADPGTEFWMGIAGPLASAAIGTACLAAVVMLGEPLDSLPQRPVASVLAWLGTINLAVAAFNLLPGFPLDGGRVLRAILWRATGDPARATRIAARVGQFVANGFILAGLIRFFSGASFNGLWLAFLGWFLLDAASVSYANVTASDTLRGVRVSDVMTRDYPVIDGEEDIRSFVTDYMLRTGRRCFVVREHGHLAGLITAHEVKAVAPARWSDTLVEAVMRPLDRIATVKPESPLGEALETMTREDVNQLPVTSDGLLQGLISRGQILQLLKTRAEVQA
jgi:Zn-dependent protease/predicted transcriptional regulator